MGQPRKNYPEEAVMAFIRGHVRSNGYPPTMSEIAVQCDLSSKATAMRVVNRLQARGLIERQPGIGRTIHIVGTVGKARTETV